MSDRHACHMVAFVLVISKCFTISHWNWIQLHLSLISVISWIKHLSTYYKFQKKSQQFLPRCMECRRGLAMRILSVCLSVTRVDCDKTVIRSVQIYISYERTFSLVFWEEKLLVGGGPFYLKYWVDRPPLEQNRRFRIARSASAVTPSEKSLINANRKSTTCFPMSLK